MNTFSLVRKALDESAKDTTKDMLNADVVEAGRVLAAVQTVVDALTPPDGGRYIVGFADIDTAGTNLSERRIIVSSKPLYDRSLDLVTKAVLLVTFAAHEIGHTLVTRPRKALIQEHSRADGFHAVANLSDDIILEPVMVERFPILADAFRFTGEWVLRHGRTPLPKTIVMTKGMDTVDRFNVLVNATRYGDIADIVWADGRALKERDWSRDWARRLCALPLNDHAGFLRLVDEAWDRIRSDENLPDEPEPEEDESDEQGESGSEGESEDGAEDDESEDDEDADGDGDGDTDDHDATDDATDGDDGEGAEGEGEDDDDGEGSDGSGDADGEGDGDPAHPSLADEPEDSDEPSEGKGTNSEDGAGSGNDPDSTGGGGNASADSNTLRDENDWNEREVDETSHDSSEGEPESFKAHDMENNIRHFASATVTAFGKHGSLPTIWD